MCLNYDIIVVGGGHAGAEAAWAASKLGARTALVTMKVDAIARMSCNPAIGGIGKGQLVNEIDALGGLMGLAIDATGIQFRVLNRSKGPAVQSPRAQADRELYSQKVRELLSGCGGLEFVEGIVESLVTEPVAAAANESDCRSVIRGIRMQDGRMIRAAAVIITSGTFMRGLMHCGLNQTQGGRVGEQASTGLSAALLHEGLQLGRLKTGTPPRVHRDTIDYSGLEVQPGDDPPQPFSFMTDRISQPQVNCWITYTTPAGHDLIRDNLDRTPMYCGQIQAQGVRYCPSIEDKVVRFADKQRHQVFLEPEGYDDDRVYCNGLGTSLPSEIQDEFVRLIPGLHQAKILQHGYAVEYDFVPTHQTKYSLETKRVEGLFLAGQINGTSGYEEAAAQGLIAGINAARKIQDEPDFILRRDQAYIGVMIDDLIARPPDEPYRMFTSRAEYRLILRSDNADERLTPVGRELGLVGDERWRRYDAKRIAIEQLHNRLQETRFQGKPLLELLRRPEVDWSFINDQLGDCESTQCASDVKRQVEIRTKYSGYIERMAVEINRLQKVEQYRIPSKMSYSNLNALRHEAREKLAAVCPQTLGQASRISGITPADVTTLWVMLESRQFKSQ